LEIDWAGIAPPDSRRSIVSEGSRRGTRFTRRVVLNGHPEYRLPNTLNVLARTMSARTSWLGSTASRPRPVPLAIPGGSNYRRCSRQWVFDPRSAWGRSASLGRYTAIEEIDAVVDRLTDVLAAGRLNATPPGLAFPIPTTSGNAPPPTISGKLLFHVIVDNFHRTFSIDGPGGPNVAPL
jgi:hypothetical protein